MATRITAHLPRVFQSSLWRTTSVKNTLSTRLTTTALRSFCPSHVSKFSQERTFSKLPPKNDGTPFTAMKLFTNLVMSARNYPKDNWAYALSSAGISREGPGITWFPGHRGVITSLDIAPEDRLVSSSQDGTCRVWDIPHAIALKTLDHGSTSVNCIQTEGYTLVSGSSDATASIWDLRTYKRIYALMGHIAPVDCIGIDNNLVATGSQDTTCRIWSAVTGKCKHILTQHTKPISCLQMLDGTLVTGSYDKLCMSWNPETGNLLQTFSHNAEVLALEFEGDTLATVTNDQTCTIWDLRDGSKPRLTLTGHRKTINCMRLQGDILVTGSDDYTLRVWNLKTGESKVVASYNCPVNRLVLRGDLVIVGLDSGTIIHEDLSKFRSKA